MVNSLDFAGPVVSVTSILLYSTIMVEAATGNM